jgi:hypothetical protein
MSRPESEHVTALKAFRQRLVEARRAAAGEADLDRALRRFTEIETAIALVDSKRCADHTVALGFQGSSSLTLLCRWPPTMARRVLASQV